MKDRPDGTVELDDSERGTLMVSAFWYALIGGLILGTFFVTSTWLFAPDMMRIALWWYPFGFVAVFLWKRHRFLARANEIIDRTNARIKEEIDRQ